MDDIGISVSISSGTDRSPRVLRKCLRLLSDATLLSSEDEGGRLSTGNREKESEHHLAVE
jgi:hypothetical protein